MRHHILTLVALIALAPLPSLDAQSVRGRTYELRGGRWLADTGFVRRRIGRLRAGDEASFLALDCNPPERLECVRDLSLRMKHGVVLGATTR